MSPRLRTLFACCSLLLLCACAATSIEKTWKAPDAQGPAGTIAVLCVEQRGMLRQAFENRFVTQLRKVGSKAFFTYDLLSLEQIQSNKQAAAERFRTNGAQSLLILRMVDISQFNREVKTGNERYMGVVTGIEPGTWYDYYSVAFMNINPTYGSLTQIVYLETSLYDLRSAKRVYSVLTRTVLKENMDRVAEMDPLVEKIVAAMRKDGVIR